ncbi:sialidase precursor, partial [Trypanosoma conorhini]
MHRCFDGVRASNGDPPSDNVPSAVGLRPHVFISVQPRKRHKGVLVGMDALSSIESHITAVPDTVVCESAFPPRSVGARTTSVVVKRTLTKKNQRIFDVGQVSIGGENSAYSSVLYKDDKLYCLHEINTDEVYSLVFARLIGELRLIKSVVRAWKEEDTHLSSICTPADPAASPSKGGCGAAVPTAGLVGFLSHLATESVWEDVYLCVNANVTNAERVPNGLRFKGVGGGALWPVSRQGQNRRYQFANYRFTLVATVTIDELPEDASPVLGASLGGSGDTELLGLSYDNNLQWRPIYKDAPVSPTG